MVEGKSERWRQKGKLGGKGEVEGESERPVQRLQGMVKVEGQGGW